MKHHNVTDRISKFRNTWSTKCRSRRACSFSPCFLHQIDPSLLSLTPFLHCLDLKIPTIVDYREVLLNIIPLERRTAHLYGFICELSLLNTGLCQYSPACLSAAALLLAKVLHQQGEQCFFGLLKRLVSEAVSPPCLFGA